MSDTTNSQDPNDAGRHALVAGIGGTIGSGVAKVLATRGWKVTGLARSASDDFATIEADLLDADATSAAVAAEGSNVTHLFYAALKPSDDLGVEADENETMLTNLLDALEAASAPLERVVHYQGFKYYGIHLGGPVRTPAVETDPPHLPPNIYIGQDRIVHERAADATWDAVVLRPDVVVAPVHGPGMSIAMVVGSFAELSREMGVPMRFPGSVDGYDVLMQFTDVELLGDASAWAAMTEGIGGRAFNVTNGDLFRWERLWPTVAEHLGMQTAPPMPLPLVDHMGSDQLRSAWSTLAERHGLVESELGDAVGWDFGDFVFNTELDVVSDLNAIRRAGFTGFRDSTASLLAAIDELKSRKVLPPTPSR